MVFNATFNNISVIPWWSVLLVEEITHLPQVTNKLYHTTIYDGQIFIYLSYLMLTKETTTIYDSQIFIYLSYLMLTKETTTIYHR
jgi:hypothetical protein